MLNSSQEMHYLISESKYQMFSEDNIVIGSDNIGTVCWVIVSKVQ